MKKDYFDGLIEGLTRFAWWKDGVQYVGTCGTTLKDAIKEVEDARQEDLIMEEFSGEDDSNGQ